jgi:DNA-binding MarR family transcriptional regulator
MKDLKWTRQLRIEAEKTDNCSQDILNHLRSTPVLEAQEHDRLKRKIQKQQNRSKNRMSLPITQAQFELLSVLHEETHNLSQAARIIGKSRSTVTQTAEHLADKGWVTEEERTAPGRYLTTSEDGETIVEMVREVR